MLINKKQLKQNIINSLCRLPHAKQRGFDQYSVRCPFCGDSYKNEDSTHLYVKIDPNDDEMPMLFHCLRCDVGGVLTPSVLRTLEINDLNINSNLISYNKRATKLYNRKLGISNNKLNYLTPLPLDNNLTEEKKRYIENRLGVSMSIEEMVRLKIVFNLADFLKQNEIERITCKKERALVLQNDFVGFLSYKNEYINFRNIRKSKERYYKYSVLRNLDNTGNFYSIPNKIDLFTNETIVINLAEGVFDILGIFYHLNKMNLTNNIYAAVCGCGFVNVLKYYLNLGLVGDNIIVNIFSDADRSPYFYRNLRDELEQWVGKINLYYNSIGKDYGVPKDKINLITKKIPKSKNS